MNVSRIRGSVRKDVRLAFISLAVMPDVLKDVQVLVTEPPAPVMAA